MTVRITLCSLHPPAGPSSISSESTVKVSKEASQEHASSPRDMKLRTWFQRSIPFIRTIQTCPQNQQPKSFGFSPRLHQNRPINPSLNQTTHYYISLLRQCTDKASLTEAREVHIHMKECGFPFLSLGNKLIDAYLKCGGIDDARQVFDEMTQRHIVAWNSMISAYLRSGRSEEALELYKMMLPHGVAADEFTFSSIFKAFSGLGLLRQGQVTHGKLVVSGVGAMNAFVCSALVDMYTKFGKLREARIVFDQVVEKDVVLFTALIVGHTKNGEDGEAITIFGKMVSEGIKANEYTFPTVLIACGNLGELSKGKLVHGAIVKLGFESKVDSQTSLLSMYSKCSLVDDSLKVFNQIHNPNLVAWTAVIAGLVQNSREESSLSMFREMMRNSVKPNAFTLSTALRACSSLAMFEQGRQIHAHVRKVGLDRDRFAGAALVDMYGKCGSIGMARQVFDNLSELDIVSINSMIYCYAQNGHGHEAIKIFKQMRNWGLEPNDATFVSILSACTNAGLLEEGCQIFSSIISNPTKDHYACMINLLGRAGRLEEAERLITQIENPDVVLWRTLLSACKIHGEVAMARRAAKNLLELQPGDDRTYILLSNIYASTGNWDEVIKMKALMRQMRLKKDPALSWVEVNREMHTFMAGDWSHPRASEIYEELERLIEKVKGLGYVPDTRFVLQDMDEMEKERSLYSHSEKLAIAFGLLGSNPHEKTDCIRIFKNLRVCGDCHTWIKLVSKVASREIIARDAKRFHHFREGLCSCGDYW